MLAASTCRLVDVGGSQQLGGAEIGVHRPLAVRGDQDHRAGGGVAVFERRRVEMDAEGVHVVAVDVAELVVGDLADEGGAAAEGGHARRGIAGAAARGLDRRAHERRRAAPIPLARPGAWTPLISFCADEEVLLGRGDDVDDGVADAEHVEAGFCHLGSSGLRRREG